jgi:hypothetical protein
MLQLSQLTAEEKALVQHELVKDVRVQGIDFSEDGDELRFDKVYLEVLSEWGIICPHPHSSVQPILGGRAHRCVVCNCIVIGDAAQVARAAP